MSPLTTPRFRSPARRLTSARALGAALAVLASACSTRDEVNRPVTPTAHMSSSPTKYSSGFTLPAGDTPPDDGQWLRASKDYANTRFSGLDQITAANVKGLSDAWSFSTGVLRGQEAAPLVVGSTMYYVTPYPNILYALDLTKDGALKWQYMPQPEAASQGVACCDLVNRGAVYENGRIYYNTLDGHTVAVDTSGKEVWNTKLGDINKGESITMAPLVVHGKVMVGVSGGEFGVRGWIQALDAGSGKVAWKAYNTGPDSEVLIGPKFKPHYDQDKGKDLGVTTWPVDGWKIGGGSVWGFVAYDPEVNLIYYGTGNPGPWNAEQRPGDNKWTAGVFARDPDTGEAHWFYQTSFHDIYDWDGINESIVVDMTVDGKPRKVLIRPERNGYVYVIDRSTGEVLSADPYGYINASKGVDLKTGRLQYVSEKHPQVGKVIRDICPAPPGVKDWNPSAFSPITGLLYVPHNNLCMDIEETTANYIAGTPFVGANVKMTAGPGGNRGIFTAWDPVARKAVWEIKERFPVWSGALVTAGGVVFYGTMDGWFKALDAKTGSLLWQKKLGSGIIGQPITYRGPDGKQYIAIASGVGGWPGAIVAGNLDPRDSSGALGFVNAMRDLKQATTKGGTIYVFALP